jgi:hypothetical protein
MGLLDGEIAAVFQGVFSDIYVNGVITRVSLIDDGLGGWSKVTESEPCKVQRDAVTQAQKLEEGYAASDVRLIVLSAIDNNCLVTCYGVTYQIGPTVTRDPANSYWEARGIKVNNA